MDGNDMAGRLSKSCEISEESDLDDFVNDVEKVILLQAVFRGCLVRKWLAEARKEFLGIAQETDPQNGNFLVEWKSPNLCAPTYTKKRRKTQRNVAQTISKRRTDDDVAELSPRGELNKQNLHVGISQCKTSAADPNQNAYCCHCSSSHSHVHVHVRHSSQNYRELVSESDAGFNKTKSRGNDKADTGDFDSGHCDITAIKDICDQGTSRTNLDNDEVADSHNNYDQFSETADLVSFVKSLGVQTDTCSQYAENQQQHELKGEARATESEHEDSTLMGVHVQRGENSDAHNLSEEKGGYSNTNSQPESPRIDVLEPHPESSPGGTLPQEDSTLQLSDNSLRAQADRTLPQSDSPPHQHAVTPPAHDSTLRLAESTSFWEDTVADTPHSNNTSDIPWPRDPVVLREKRQHIAMELLWVQQAILSRKNYLRLKQQMKSPLT